MVDALTRLAQALECYKGTMRGYTPVYHRTFESLRDSPLTLLELDVQPIGRSATDGASLRMWRAYFPKGRIVGTTGDGPEVELDRIRMFHGVQEEPGFLRRVQKAEGPFDIIIDSGHPRSPQARVTFETLFPLLKEGGFYAAENLYASYWSKSGGVMRSPCEPQTALGYFKGLADAMHFAERPGDPDDISLNVGAVHFYNNLCIVEKRRFTGHSYGARPLALTMAAAHLSPELRDKSDADLARWLKRRGPDGVLRLLKKRLPVLMAQSPGLPVPANVRVLLEGPGRRAFTFPLGSPVVAPARRNAPVMTMEAAPLDWLRFLGGKVTTADVEARRLNLGGDPMLMLDFHSLIAVGVQWKEDPSKGGR